MSITLKGLVELTSRAITHGASRIEGTNAFEWDVGAYCDAPFNRTLHARGYDTEIRKEKWKANPGSLSLHLQGLPCRKCDKCRYIKQSEWTDRILREMAMHNRSWFVTLTMNPEEHHRSYMEELAFRNSRGWRDTDFDKASDEWRVRCEAASKLLTKFLKRVRKPLAGESAVSFSYVAVTEPHKNGLPHFHLIMCERGGSLTYRRICERWTHGHSDASLVKDPVGAGKYVAKYITKESSSRIRASIRFGELPSNGKALDELEARIAAYIGLADQSEGTDACNPLEKGLSPKETE